MSTRVLQKMLEMMGVAAQLSLPFQMENWLHRKKVEKSNISGTSPPMFFNLSPCVSLNNGLLNENYWDDLDIINQGHSKGNVSQF